MAIKVENWDGVAAPAMPSGWVAGASYLTQTAQYWTNPNALTNNTAANTDLCYWGSNTDGNSGDARAYILAFCKGSASGSRVSAYCRMTVPSTTLAGLTSYWTEYDWTGGALTLYKTVGGSTSTLGTLSVVLALNTGYRFYCRCVGTAIAAQVIDENANTWLNNAGSFVSGEQQAIAVTDSPGITGPGYAGVGVFRSILAGDKVYADPWIFETVGVNVSRRRVQTSFL